MNYVEAQAFKWTVRAMYKLITILLNGTKEPIFPRLREMKADIESTFEPSVWSPEAQEPLQHA